MKGKLKGGALFYVVIITLIISLSCSAFIYSALLSKWSVHEFITTKRLIDNVQSTNHLISQNPEICQLNETIIVDLYKHKEDSVEISRKPWGLYEFFAIKAFSGNDTIGKTFLAGTKIHENNALYVSDQGRPIKLAGNTIINGTCYIPKAGVERAYIEGKAFSGNKLISGIIKISINTLPEINKPLIKELRMVLDRGIQNIESANNSISRSFNIINETTSFEINDSITNSFSNETVVYNYPKSVTINGSLSRNVIVYAKDFIKISSQAHLDGIILFASKIEVEPGFSGSLQAFASDSIHIGERCTFNYPSVLGLLPSKTTVSSPGIYMKEHNILSGTIFCYEQVLDIRKRPIISVGKNSKINGELYSTALIDLKGVVYGQVICEKFILRTASSTYENHLLDCEINGELLPDIFLNSRLQKGNEYKIGVAKDIKR